MFTLSLLGSPSTDQVVRGKREYKSISQFNNLYGLAREYQSSAKCDGILL
jgi:hypothetical protein